MVTGNMQAVLNRMREIEQRFSVGSSQINQAGPSSDFAKKLTSATASAARETGSFAAAGESGSLTRALEQSAAKYGVDPALAKTVAQIESNNDAAAVSEAGAQGVMQLMPETARQLGVDDPFNPAENIDGGVRYLKSLLDKYGGNVSMALAAYNAGPGNVERYGGIPPFKETQQYVAKALEVYRQFK